MTKKKKDDKTTDAPAPVQPRDENTPAPAAVTPPEETEEREEMFDDIPPPPDATERLMELAFDTWARKQVEGVMYYMTRTFTHHRLGEKFGTHLVFNALEQLNKGKHEELLEQIEAFRHTLFSELDEYIAERNAKR